MWVLTILFISGVQMDINQYEQKQDCVTAGRILYMSGNDVVDFKCEFKKLPR